MVKFAYLPPIKRTENTEGKECATNTTLFYVSFKICADIPSLRDRLDVSLNEYWLLHGTKRVYVEEIAHVGFDNRMASPGGLFGSGVYFTSSLSKADQYSGL